MWGVGEVFGFFVLFFGFKDGVWGRPHLRCHWSRLEGNVYIWECSDPGKGNSKCRSLKVGVWLVFKKQLKRPVYLGQDE